MHEQVQQQLDYLKYLVDIEIKQEERCKKLGIRYTPSIRKWIDIDNYNEYKKEIERNGDKNLIVMVKINGKTSLSYGKILPFAKREVHMSYGTYFLVHRTKDGAELLMREDEAEVVER